MAGILIDTNVLVYVYDARDAARQKRAADTLLRLAEAGAGRLSAQCLAEFFSVTTRTRQPLLSRTEAVLQLEHWMRAFPVYDVTEQIVLEAGRGARDHNLPYYDAQIWAAARLNQLAAVFSEDFQDGLILEGVRFANPFAAWFEIGEWV
jgi:predicted nucleic acid-binding protein